ncbi:hypothetical protein NP233_g4034 [Leucocoprinus birnbaumii]|uniref:F-box domain-containing protein n=1 Tax=Leucocoprinus birnbaumii TaxID=56174 RepID=A0AAD5VZ63_9AGAR|nr:hypothetical protein NP233_g4034 [Leucocoprinus birnbaumii]
MDNLPSELLLKIASFVRNSDTQTLLAGAAISPSLRPAFLEYLSKRITLNLNSDKGLRALYTSDPKEHLARERYLKGVRDLTIWNPNSREPGSSPTSTKIDLSPVSMIKCLNNLAVLCLNQPTFNWENLSLDQTREIVSIFSLPTLKTVVVHAIAEREGGFPLSLLTLLPSSLHKLYIKYEPHVYWAAQRFPNFDRNIETMRFENARNVEAARSVQGPMLQEDENREGSEGPVRVGQPLSLRFTLRFASLAAILQLMKFLKKADMVDLKGPLELVYIEPWGPTTPKMAIAKMAPSRCLEILGANLTQLRLHVSVYNTAQTTVPLTKDALNNLHNLESLALTMRLLYIDNTDLIPPFQTWFSTTLSHLGSAGKITLVEICYPLLVRSECVIGAPEMAALSFVWHEIDQILGGPKTRFTSLRDCNIRFSMHRDGCNFGDSFRHIKQNMLEQGCPLAPAFAMIRRKGVNMEAMMEIEAEYYNYFPDCQSSFVRS